MALVRFAYGSNRIAMFARSQPIEQLRADRPSALAAVRRINRTRTAGDQQHHTRAHRPCLRHSIHQLGMRTVEIVAMQIEREIWCDIACFQLAVPMPVESALIARSRRANAMAGRHCRALRGKRYRLSRHGGCCGLVRCDWLDLRQFSSLQRRDAGGELRPSGSFFSAQAARDAHWVSTCERRKAAALGKNTSA